MKYNLTINNKGQTDGLISFARNAPTVAPNVRFGVHKQTY
jgi:hypothetical protein